MKKILLPLTLLAFAAACGDSSTTSPTATVGPETPGPTFDNISNNIDASIDAVAEVMPLTVGGANGTTTLYVDPTNGDGKNGCNFQGNTTTLVVAVSSSNPAAATVSPSSLTFGSCGDVKTLTVTAVAAGSATISVTQTSNNTEATFNLVPATFTVNVSPPPNTAPTIAVAGVTGGASYPKGAVPAAACQVTDAEDGNSSFAATLSAITGPNAGDAIGSQTASCTYTDGGGRTATSSVTYDIVDPSAPSISYIVDPATPDGNNDWYKSDVTLTWTVDDPESPNSLLKTGAKTGCVDQNIIADQTEQTYACSATSAGGTTGPQSVSIKRDATPPTITASHSPAANAAGWNKADVTVSFSGSDDLSGLDPSSCTAAVTISTETSSQSVPGSCADNAGNSGSATATVKLDKTVPTITGGRMPAANSHGWNNGGVTVSFTCGDALSGIQTCTPSSTVNGEGAGQSVTGTAVDKADNSASATVSGINIDLTAPDVGVTGVTQGATYTLGSVPAAGCNTTDALSGVATTATVALSGGQTVGGGTVGSITANCTGATDKAGNTGSKSVTYNVVFAWTGFFQPVDNGNVFNGVKAGSAIPVKFSLGGNQGLSIFASGYPKVQTVACNTAAPLDEIEVTVTAGNSSLTYDAVAGQYVYVWKTDKGWAGTCRVLQVTLADDTQHTAYFQFK